MMPLNWSVRTRATPSFSPFDIVQLGDCVKCGTYVVVIEIE